VNLTKREFGTLLRIQETALKITCCLNDYPLLIQHQVVIWQSANKR